jgi:hypothetical protein
VRCPSTSFRKKDVSFENYVTVNNAYLDKLLQSRFEGPTFLILWLAHESTKSVKLPMMG